MSIEAKGVSSIRKANEELPNVLSALGVRLSDVLSADRVLVVEGASDQAILEAWFGDDLARHRVHIVVASGGDLSWQAKKLTDLLESLEEIDRPTLFIRDRDELDDESLRQLQRKGVHVLDVREMENYLCDPIALKGQLPGLAKKDETEIKVELRAIADTLREQVIVKRIIQRLRRHQRMIEHSDAAELLADGADAEKIAGFYKGRASTFADLAATAAALWNEVEQDLNQRWDAGWHAIAPGEEMLKQMYAKHGGGRGFGRKTVEGPELARRMAPPQQLRDVLDRFLTGSPE